MRNHSKLPLLLCCLGLLFAIPTLQAQERSQRATARICQKCCDCADLKKGSEAYAEAGCADIEEVCNEIYKSGTGPVVVGGSRNEFAGSGDCTCNQSSMIVVGEPTSVLATIRGPQRPMPLKVLVEVYDSKGQKVFTGGERNFNAVIMQKGSKLKNVKTNALKLRPKQRALVQVPIRLKPGIRAGNGRVKIIFFIENPKTKQRKVLKEKIEKIKISTRARSRK